MIDQRQPNSLTSQRFGASAARSLTPSVHLTDDASNELISRTRGTPGMSHTHTYTDGPSLARCTESRAGLSERGSKSRSRRRKNSDASFETERGAEDVPREQVCRTSSGTDKERERESERRRASVLPDYPVSLVRRTAYILIFLSLSPEKT